MKKLIITSTIIMMCSCLFAQSGKQDLIYSAISKDSTIICYNEINGIKYEIIQIKTWNKDEKRFRINNEIIDTILINHYDWKIPFCYKQSVFFGEATNTKMPVYYKFNQNKIEKIEGVFLYDDFQKNAYCIDSTETKLFEVNPITSEKSLLYDFCKGVPHLQKTEYGNYDQYIYKYNICFLSEDSVFVSLCDSYWAENVFTNYYIITKGNVKNITDHFKKGESIVDEYIDYIASGMVMSHHSYDEYKHTINSREFTKEYPFIQFNKEKRGLNYNNDNINYYYLHSELDNKLKVFLPYKFNPQLEIQMYRAYNDSMLTETDIVGLGKYELGILRNLLFAKHNYKFKSEFYQAYFNMYGFYREKEKSTTRKGNVDSLLTASDKANIALIRRMEAKLK